MDRSRAAIAPAATARDQRGHRAIGPPRHHDRPLYGGCPPLSGTHRATCLLAGSQASRRQHRGAGDGSGGGGPGRGMGARGLWCKPPRQAGIAPIAGRRGRQVAARFLARRASEADVHVAFVPAPGADAPQPRLAGMQPAEFALDRVVHQDAIHLGARGGQTQQPHMVGGEAAAIHLLPAGGDQGGCGSPPAPPVAAAGGARGRARCPHPARSDGWRGPRASARPAAGRCRRSAGRAGRRGGPRPPRPARSGWWRDGPSGGCARAAPPASPAPRAATPRRRRGSARVGEPITRAGPAAGRETAAQASAGCAAAGGTRTAPPSGSATSMATSRQAMRLAARHAATSFLVRTGRVSPARQPGRASRRPRCAGQGAAAARPPPSRSRGGSRSRPPAMPAAAVAAPRAASPPPGAPASLQGVGEGRQLAKRHHHHAGGKRLAVAAQHAERRCAPPRSPHGHRGCHRRTASAGGAAETEVGGAGVSIGQRSRKARWKLSSSGWTR